jgi:hypothetical protein
MMMMMMMIVTVGPKLYALNSHEGCEDKAPLILGLSSNWRFGLFNPGDKSLITFRIGTRVDHFRRVNEDWDFRLPPGFAPLRSALVHSLSS